MMVFLILLGWILGIEAKEVALSFDDIPGERTPLFSSLERAEKLVADLKELGIDEVLIFAHPCKGDRSLEEIKHYHEAGHRIANHTCSHLKLSEVGEERFMADVKKAHELLKPFLKEKKFFRFPFFNEGQELSTQDSVRKKLQEMGYSPGPATVLAQDWIFTSEMNRALLAGKKVKLVQVGDLFVETVLTSLKAFDELAQKILGYSPKHVLLLHETDVVVLNLKRLVKEMRKAGWEIIPATRAYQDKLYQVGPRSTFSEQGLLVQWQMEKTGKVDEFKHFKELENKLLKVLGSEQN